MVECFTGSGWCRCRRPFTVAPPSWLELWRFARYNLRLSEAEFWRLTLAQYNALTERYRSEQEWLDYRTGIIAAVIANVNRDPKKRRKPYHPQDFMPGKQSRKRVKPAEKPSQEAMLDYFKVLTASMGGTIMEKTKEG